MRPLWFLSRSVGDVIVVTFLEGVGSGGDVFWRVDEIRVAMGDSQRLVLNLSHLPGVTSIFLGMLIRLQRRLQCGRDSLRLCGLRPETRDVFRATRLENIFDLYREERDAIESFPSLM
jgi:anti-anti-sigma factor